jgi:hypothetical protein
MNSIGGLLRAGTVRERAPRTLRVAFAEVSPAVNNHRRCDRNAFAFVLTIAARTGCDPVPSYSLPGFD